MRGVYRRSLVLGMGSPSVLRGEERGVVLQRGAVHQFRHLQHIHCQHHHDDNPVRPIRNMYMVIYIKYNVGLR